MTYKQTICLAGVATVLALAAVSLGLLSRHSTAAAVGSSSPLPASSPVGPMNPAAGSTGPAVAQAPEEEPGVPPLPANATHVPDDYLLKLSALVHLANADEHRIDKERWGRALPIAERLAQAPCDCEQRNWLNHFISMGQDALSGADDNYYRTAVLMQTMARNDRQLADHPELFAH